MIMSMQGLSNYKKIYIFVHFVKKSADILHTTEDVTQKQMFRNRSNLLHHFNIVIVIVSSIASAY